MLPFLRKNDIWLAAALVLIGVGLFFVPTLFTPSANLDTAHVVISINGSVYREVPLPAVESICIETEYGINTVSINGNAISIAEADCPDTLCVRHGAISQAGDTIICLPHRVAVYIKGLGTGADDELDAVAR